MSTCTICFMEHDHLWYDPAQQRNKPSMFCEPCAKLKGDSRGKYQEVVIGLFLGDYEAANTFKGETLCVHEDDEFAVGWHIPILVKKPNSHMDRTGALVSRKKLNTAIEFIGSRLNHSSVDLLVHCKGGVERSPLVVAHYLTHSYASYSIDEAYAYLKKIRPVISERKFWLP